MKRGGPVPFWGGMIAALVVGWFGLPLALYEKIEQPVQFSHQMHVGDSVGLTCEDCHSYYDDGRFSGIPVIEKCAECHSEVLGETENEKRLVEEYIQPNLEVPWMIYARQPENVFFSHAVHSRMAELSCQQCHGEHGTSTVLRPLQRNRISGYSRDIWGSSMSRLRNAPWEGKKMDDCSRCHTERGVQENCLDCHK
jgi:hypothetical protein